LAQRIQEQTATTVARLNTSRKLTTPLYTLGHRHLYVLQPIGDVRSNGPNLSKGGAHLRSALPMKFGPSMRTARAVRPE
jgi:hypothetical protein